MSKRSLDDIIKAALRKVEETSRSSDWNAFEGMLEDQPLTETDELIKDHLERIRPDSRQAWHIFEDKFADELGQEHPIDQKIKENLKGHEAAYSESSWKRLSHLLDLTDQRERDLLIRKIGEVLTVSLLLFLLIPQFFIKKNVSPAPLEQNRSYAQSQSQSEESAIITPIPWVRISNIPIRDIPFNKFNENANIIASFEVGSKAQKTMAEQKDLSLLDLPLRPIPEAKPRNSSYPLLSPGEPVMKWPEQSLTEAAEVSDPSTSVLVSATNSAPKSLSFLPFLDINELRSTDSDIQMVAVENLFKERSLSFGTYYAPKMVHIFTPFDPVYDNDPYGRLKVYQEWGVEVEKQTGNKALGGSISYGKLSYRPPVVLEAYGGNIAEVSADSINGGYRSLSLSNIDLTMLSASLYMRHYFPISQSLKWFTHFGGGINMVLTTDYHIQDIVDNSDGTFTETRYDMTDIERSAATDHVRLRQKNFEGGILEGGNFNRNSYMDFEMGAGLEYEINQNASIYIASILNISPFSDGLGPNRDRINNIDLKIGFKHWL